MEKDVAIIITCYNYGQYLTEAIESALNQTISCEVIVVDDGSTDNTRDICIPYFDRIIYLYKPNGKTNAASKNYGIKHTSCKWIVTLDADDVLMPDMVRKCLNALNGKGIVTINAQEFELSDNVNYSSMMSDQLYHGNNIMYCALVKRNLWKMVGGYDEDVPISGIEDWTFWIKMYRNTIAQANLNECLFKYRVHAGSMTQTNIAPNGQLFHDWMVKKGYL